LRKNCDQWAGDDPKRPRLQNLVTRQILITAIRHDTEIHGSPKAVTRKLIGIPLVVRVFVMQSMPIHPGDRIYIDPEGVVQDRDSFYEPFLIVERTMGDTQMKNVGQIQPGDKPTKNKINSAY
jgi:hypothetical protein